MRYFGVDEYAVSPVIGVVVMVGMTVIMVSAVTVSVFSFSIPERAPQARIVVVEAKGDLGETALNKSSITLKHKGGDALFENETRIIITGKGYAYTSGSDHHLHDATDIRVTYKDLAGENYISGFDNEIVAGTTWDAGETVTLYGSDGRDFELYGWHNNVDSKWKLDDGYIVSVTIIDTITNQIIATSSVTVKHP
ncbi:MAG: type IV pilin [Candidatus Methanoperedens sp.]